MFDGPKSLIRKFENAQQSHVTLSHPAETAGFIDSNEAYQQLKKDAMEKVLKAAPKHMRKRLAAYDC
tara:strand:- start:903 stop:1103 length:201 start_codon:yes stop_codon:yes gene_type:complete